LPAIIGLAFFLGCLTIYLRDQTFSNKITETRLRGNYKFINPLLECDSTAFGTDSELDNLKTKVQTYIKTQTDSQKISFAAVYYRDLNNGPWFGINSSELFSPASLIKVPLMIAYFKMADSNPSILQKQLFNTQTFNPVDQNIQPEITLTPNQKYTVEELIQRMIIYSDNLAYNLLNDNIDAQTVINVYNDLGVDISNAKTNPDGNIVSVKSYAAFLRILYNSSYLSKNMSEKALQLLSLSKFTQGIVAGVPQNVTVAHKFGERQYVSTGQKQLHDCGIIYLPENPYLICIMTRGQNFNELIGTIRDISSQVYAAIVASAAKN
jgi:beta-lactamase class A